MKANKAELILRLVLLGVLLLTGAKSVVVAAERSERASQAEAPKILPYKITRGDKLAVQVLGESDLTAGNKRVEQRGTINLTLIGDIQVYGLTLGEAATTIEQAYKDGRLLRNPQVTVSVEEYAARIAIVSGKVKLPQRVNLPPERAWTIKDVISLCGGFEETARGTDVRVTRKLPDGTTKTWRLDVQSALTGKDTKSNDAAFTVEPDDTIYVPEKII